MCFQNRLSDHVDVVDAAGQVGDYLPYQNGHLLVLQGQDLEEDLEDVYVGHQQLAQVSAGCLGLLYLLHVGVDCLVI